MLIACAGSVRMIRHRCIGFALTATMSELLSFSSTKELRLTLMNGKGTFSYYYVRDAGIINM
jgi:hypothetical protein